MDVVIGQDERGDDEFTLNFALGKIIIADHGENGLDIEIMPTEPSGEGNMNRLRISEGGDTMFVWVRGESEYGPGMAMEILLQKSSAAIVDRP